MNSNAVRELLIASRSWSASPWDYSSMIYLQFQADDTGLAIFGHGQTIHAKINFRYAIDELHLLSLTYLASPSRGRFSGFVPTSDTFEKSLAFSLVEKQTTFDETFTSNTYRFRWILGIEGSPFPDSLTFPYPVPREYYGYREAIPRGGAEDVP